MPKREYDPLALIPSAATLRRKLDEARERVRKLRVMLTTAERIERAAAATPPEPDRREVGRG